RWQQESRACRAYVTAVCLAAVPFAVLCFKAKNDYSLEWLLFTIISAFVATINVRLPKLSAVISMGDVFIIFALMQFGAGAALVTYWIDIAAAVGTDHLRKHGLNLKGKFYLHRWFFNVACCALSTWTMYALYTSVIGLPLAYPINIVAGLFSVAIGWFLVN